MATNCSRLTSKYVWTSHPFRFENFFTDGAAIVDLSGTTCPTDDRFFSGTGLLTNSACEALAGKSWYAYPTADIVRRIITWKLPLVQLMSQFPRPPLGYEVEALTFLHLAGDPIDTLASLLYTLTVTQVRVKRLRRRESNVQGWKVVALLMVSYEEIGDVTSVNHMEDIYCAKDIETAAICKPVPPCCTVKARALAADRTTSLVPVVIAELIFIFSFALAYSNVFSDKMGTSNWWNVELHSVAFSLTIIWVIPTVMLGSLIGIPQSDTSTSRILTELGGHNPDECAIPQDSTVLEEPHQTTEKEETNHYQRIFNGALPSFRPDKWTNRNHNRHFPNARASASRQTPYLLTISILIVANGVLSGILLSSFVPPDGWGPRQCSEFLMLLIWLISALLQHLLDRCPLSKPTRFWLTMAKDTISTLCAATNIILTQFGWFNRCSAWTRWGRAGLALPTVKTVHDVLMRRSRCLYPAIIFSGIAVEMLCCVGIAWWYRDALRVFLQRDNGGSNLSFGQQKKLSNVRGRCGTIGEGDACVELEEVRGQTEAGTSQRCTGTSEACSVTGLDNAIVNAAGTGPCQPRSTSPTAR